MLPLSLTCIQGPATASFASDIQKDLACLSGSPELVFVHRLLNMVLLFPNIHHVLQMNVSPTSLPLSAKKKYLAPTQM